MVSNRLVADLSEAAILLVRGDVRPAAISNSTSPCFGWPNGFEATAPLSHGGARRDAITCASRA